MFKDTKTSNIMILNRITVSKMVYKNYGFKIVDLKYKGLNYKTIPWTSILLRNMYNQPSQLLNILYPLGTVVYGR